MKTGSEIIVAPKERKRKTLEKSNPSSDKEEKSVITKCSLMDDENQLKPFEIALDSSLGFQQDDLVHVQSFDFNSLSPESSQTSPANRGIKSVFCNVVLQETMLHGAIISESTAQYLSAQMNSRLRISLAFRKQIDNLRVVLLTSTPNISSSKATETVKSISIVYSTILTATKIEYLMDQLSLTGKFILYDQMQIEIPLLQTVLFSITSIQPETVKQKTTTYLDTPPFIILSDYQSISDLEFEVQTNPSLKSTNTKPLFNVKPSDMPGYKDKLDEAFHYLTKAIKISTVLDLNTPPLGGLLVTGSSGSGKTTLVHTISTKLSIQSGVFIIPACCGDWKTTPISKIIEFMDRLILQATWQQPSLLILEDLDVLIGIADEHERSVTGSRLEQLSHYFSSTLLKSIETSHVFLVATAKSKTSLYPGLLKSLLFDKYVHLEVPGKRQRCEILKSLMKKDKLDVDVGVEDLAFRMDGYSLSDMNSCYDQVQQQALIRGLSTNTTTVPTHQDFEKVLSNFTPQALSSSKLEKPSTTFAQIGGTSFVNNTMNTYIGLNQVKKILLEMLLWPSRYPQIFSQSPLRHRSGLLLYGHPGCGKTMLASSLARECNLNLITIKGPELLNKYIGQSEKGVRDVFDRASSAQPSLLFFDEFDSIAPRRGHDNSGVTDRVVNQLLTELDGAEGMRVGVYVVAATSRPDLIDPALLRPGRLDKSVLCGVPSLEERIEILECVAKTIVLDQGIDLKSVAQDTEGFSGADLQGFLYSAQLLAIHQQMDMITADLPDEPRHSSRSSSVNHQILQGSLEDGTFLESLQGDSKPDSTTKTKSNPVLFNFDV